MAIHFGAGNVGRGFLGQVYDESGFHTLFVDVDPVIVDALNREGKYRLRLSGAGGGDFTVRNVSAVSGRDTEAVSVAMVTADIISTAVGKDILERLVPVFLKGFEKRMQASVKDPLNIIICENLLDAEDFLMDRLLKQASGDMAEYIKHDVGLGQAIISRMVIIPPAEVRAADPLFAQAEAYFELPVHVSGLKGEIPDLEWMRPFDNMQAEEARKLYMHNCSHALFAYLGFIRGYETLTQAVDDEQLRRPVLKMLDDVADCLTDRYGLDHDYLQKHGKELVRRFRDPELADTVYRVGRDPARKLSADDRLVGTLKLLASHGRPTGLVEKGIAAGFFFNPPGESMAQRFQETIKHSGIDNVIKETCGLDTDSGPGLRIKKMIASMKKEYQDNARSFTS